MGNTQLYHARKGQGVCPRCGIEPPCPRSVLCVGCAQKAAARKAAWAKQHPERIRAAQARYWDRQHTAAGPNLVACCGSWHPIGPLPYRLPCCGRVIGDSKESARA